MAKILVIDDTQDHLNLLKIMLEVKGHKVEISSTPQCGLTKLGTFQPDIILLDVFLREEFSGRELCKKIKVLNPYVIIILLSADQNALENFHECQADGIIEKPFEIKTIFETINRYDTFSTT